ncbi:MAG: bifunctional folylpolyglutamate synthase/dihydrofolate synthase [Planctomycetes bacterium]|nr:bifunctional folylpolyglutamate synthase/dihydrofolate synthase [Planctomycetota bacterium]
MARSSESRSAYAEVLSYLDSFTNYERITDFTAGPETLGLGRFRALLEHLDNPQKSFQSIHIAGTKGKGSTTIMASELLRARGLKVGVYTSPHLVSVRERILIDSQPITPEDFCEAFEQVKPALQKLASDAIWKPITYFETLTAIAFVAFEQHCIEVAVAEVGLGGRFDATNVLTPIVTAITPVSLDHTRQLGDTIPAIAAEKGGIIKEGIPLILGRQVPEAESVLAELAAERKAPVYAYNTPALTAEIKPVDETNPRSPQELSLTTWRGFYNGIRLALLGDHQAENAAVAAGIVEKYYEATEQPALNKAELQNAWSKLRIPGRIEIISHSPWVILDSAHNTASIWAAAETIRKRFIYETLVIVFAAARDKDIPGMLQILAPLADHIIVTESGHERCESAEVISKLIEENFATRVTLLTNPESAFTAAKQEAGSGGMVYITGSFYLAGRIKKFLQPELQD